MRVRSVGDIFFSVSLFASFVHFVHLLCLTRYFFPTLVKKKVTAKERIGNENISLPRARAGRSLSSLSSFLVSFFPRALIYVTTILAIVN